MEISVDQIRSLRELTGAGIMDCKKALEEAQGDPSKAEQILRASGIARAASKAGREAREGIVETYVHSGGRIGAMVELNCESDFVARLSEFKDLAHQLALQVVGMRPEYVDRSDMDGDDKRDPEEVCLLLQPFIRDDSKVIKDMVTELAARVGENVVVRRFSRFELGGEE
ncbi:MAG: translation elongation factor Ts [Chloroflexi bacterium]|nr:translation elongation factor Ts [Chloroflexota bacterium]